MSGDGMNSNLNHNNLERPKTQMSGEAKAEIYRVCNEAGMTSTQAEVVLKLIDRDQEAIRAMREALGGIDLIVTALSQKPAEHQPGHGEWCPGCRRQNMLNKAEENIQKMKEALSLSGERP